MYCAKRRERETRQGLKKAMLSLTIHSVLSLESWVLSVHSKKMWACVFFSHLNSSTVEMHSHSHSHSHPLPNSHFQFLVLSSLLLVQVLRMGWNGKWEQEQEEVQVPIMKIEINCLPTEEMMINTTKCTIYKPIYILYVPCSFLCAFCMSFMCRRAYVQACLHSNACK